MKTSILDFNKETCELFTPFPIFCLVHKETAGDPCKTGCAFFEGGRCPGYLALIKDNKPKQIHKKTNAEIGEELHCSARQVSKRRKEGTLPDRFK